MDNVTKIEIFKKLLSSLRTISLKNAADKLGLRSSEIAEILQEMEIKGYLRIVKAKGCMSSCSSCNSCSANAGSEYNGDEIVVSLLYDRTKEYADE